jgi:hypothetical protein
MVTASATVVPAFSSIPLIISIHNSDQDFQNPTRSDRYLSLLFWSLP